MKPMFARISFDLQLFRVFARFYSLQKLFRIIFLLSRVFKYQKDIGSVAL